MQLVRVDDTELLCGHAEFGVCVEDEIFERLLQLLANYSWIAPLHIAQQAFFGCEQGAPAVHIDTAALEHDSRALGAMERTNCTPTRAYDG